MAKRKTHLVGEAFNSSRWDSAHGCHTASCAQRSGPRVLPELPGGCRFGWSPRTWDTGPLCPSPSRPHFLWGPLGLQAGGRGGGSAAPRPQTPAHLPPAGSGSGRPRSAGKCSGRKRAPGLPEGRPHPVTTKQPKLQKTSLLFHTQISRFVKKKERKKEEVLAAGAAAPGEPQPGPALRLSGRTCPAPASPRSSPRPRSRPRSRPEGLTVPVAGRSPAAPVLGAKRRQRARTVCGAGAGSPAAAAGTPRLSPFPSRGTASGLATPPRRVRYLRGRVGQSPAPACSPGAPRGCGARQPSWWPPRPGATPRGVPGAPQRPRGGPGGGAHTRPGICARRKGTEAAAGKAARG